MQRIQFLNGFHLKLIAICTMLIDHMGYTLFPGVMWLRCVGRVAFPIFCFLIAEGCVYTCLLYTSCHVPPFPGSSTVFGQQKTPQRGRRCGVSGKPS